MGTGLDLLTAAALFPKGQGEELFTALSWSGGDAPEEELGVSDDEAPSLLWLGGVTTFLDLTNGDIQLFILKQKHDEYPIYSNRIRYKPLLQIMHKYKKST